MSFAVLAFRRVWHLFYIEKYISLSLVQYRRSILTISQKDSPTASPTIVTVAPAASRIETRLFDIVISVSGTITGFTMRVDNEIAIPGNTSGGGAFGSDGGTISAIRGLITNIDNN